MKKSTDIILHLIFIAIAVTELAGRWMDDLSLEFPVKPLIMVWIAVYFLLARNKKNFTLPVLLAFFFSWAGDILLMLSHYNEKPLLFYGGVGGFFFAQLLYIYIFTRYNESGGAGFVRKRMYFALVFAAYLVFILYLVFPGLDSLPLKLIISIYGLSLVGMSMMALNRKGRVGRQSFLLVFLGSALFVLSDSMIALFSFRFDPETGASLHSGFWIMMTYIPAQYLIMRGLVKEKKVS